MQDPLPGVVGAFEYRESQFPPPHEIEGYAQIDPQFARDIFDMAKANQQAQIDAKLIPIRAEAHALKVATWFVSSAPTLLIVAAVILALNGHDTAAIVAGLAGIIGGGAQIIQSTRRPRVVQQQAPQPRSTPRKKRKKK